MHSNTFLTNPKSKIKPPPPKMSHQHQKNIPIDCFAERSSQPAVLVAVILWPTTLKRQINIITLERYEINQFSYL